LAGIRPDSIKTGQGLTKFANDWKIMAEVIVCEVLGGQSLLEFSIGGNTLLAELEGRIIAKPGEKMELGFDLNRLLFFDPETEKAIV
jgi:multiple sugar transport system ATP-binding protein